MKYRWLAIAPLAVAFSAAAAATDPPVLAELARRSSLPAAEIAELLGVCDSSQQAMYFCAWRDQISAEQSLRRVEDERIASAPACKVAFEATVDRWLRARDVSCDRSSRRQFGHGSMAPTARSICATKQTRALTSQVRGLRHCAPRVS